MKARRLIVTLGALILIQACTTLKAETFTTDMIAIRGYDPVAYHTESMPVPGNPEYSYEYNDAIWQFASEENKQLFRDDPDRYIPQYGGYCAYAMSKGFVASTDPYAWTIDDDKLYLNYSLSVRKTWLKDIPGYVTKADDNWQEKVSQQDFE